MEVALNKKNSTVSPLFAGSCKTLAFSLRLILMHCCLFNGLGEENKIKTLSEGKATLCRCCPLCDITKGLELSVLAQPD